MKRKPKKFTKFHHVERVKKGRKLVEKLFVETEKGVEEYGTIRLSTEKPLADIDLTDEREPGKGVFIKGVLGKYGVFEKVKEKEVRGLKVVISGGEKRRYRGYETIKERHWKKSRGRRRYYTTTRRVAVWKYRTKRTGVSTRIILTEKERTAGYLEGLIAGRIQGALATKGRRVSSGKKGAGLRTLKNARFKISVFY